VHALTLRLSVTPSPATRPILRRIAAAPAPALSGLRARQWRAERRSIRGVYVFDERPGIDAHADDPACAFLPGAEVESIAEIPAATFDRPIFLIGAPRAGGTLLYELLVRAQGLFSLDGESHGVIEGIPSLHPATRGFASHRLTDIDATPDAIAALHAGLLADLRDRDGNAYLQLAEKPARVRILEKTPENSLRIPFLHAAFPDARFVLLHRDARQNISSLAEAWQHEGFVNIPELPGWDRERWCFLLPEEWQSQNGRSISDVAAFQWRSANVRAMDDLEALPRSQWTSIDYSELVSAPARVVRKLCAFLDVEVDDELAATLARPLALSSTTLTPPSPVKWRSNRFFDPHSLDGLGPIEGRLRNLMVHPTPPSRTPARLAAVRFACFLGEGERSETMRDDAIVHPSLQLQIGTTVPLPLVRRTRHRERFLPDHPIAWIEDPATTIWSPFFARRSQLRALMQLRAGEPPPASADVALLAPLLTSARELEERRRDGEAMIDDARGALVRERLCLLPSLLHPMQVRALARYYRELIEAGWSCGDDQVERRHGWHNEPLCSFLHHQLTEVVARIANEPVKATYCYASAYRGSAALSAHLDRRQCEYTLSLLIDHRSESSPDPWPLWFWGPDGKVSVNLEIGDAALFRGCELPHWREAAPADQDQITLLFHWVPGDFAGVLD
jgi:hypothetical protein